MSEKYAFMAEEYAGNKAAGSADAPTLNQMLAWMGVSKSGYYEWWEREPSVSERRREALKLRIGALFDSFGGTYGYRRIHAELLRGGEQVGDELVRRLMRGLGLVPVQPRPYRVTTVRGAEEPAVPDLLGRDFTADRPGVKLVGDIIYIATWQGWLYVATTIDCFNKEVIGYAMAGHMRTELVTEALEMAARNRVSGQGKDSPLLGGPRASLGEEELGAHRGLLPPSAISMIGAGRAGWTCSVPPAAPCWSPPCRGRPLSLESACSPLGSLAAGWPCIGVPDRPAPDRSDDIGPGTDALVSAPGCTSRMP